jgi:hypothetical protein
VGDRRGENRRKKRPEALEPVNTVFLRENIPLIALTGIIGCADMWGAFGHGGGEQGILGRVVVSHGKEEIPEERKLLLPGRRADGVVMTLNGPPRRIGGRMEPLLSKLVVYAVVNRVDPVGQILEARGIEGMFFIVIR